MVFKFNSQGFPTWGGRSTTVQSTTSSFIRNGFVPDVQRWWWWWRWRRFRNRRRWKSTAHTGRRWNAQPSDYPDDGHTSGMLQFLHNHIFSSPTSPKKNHPTYSSIPQYPLLTSNYFALRSMCCLVDVLKKIVFFNILFNLTFILKTEKINKPDPPRVQNE